MVNLTLRAGRVSDNDFRATQIMQVGIPILKFDAIRFPAKQTEWQRRPLPYPDRVMKTYISR